MSEDEELLCNMREISISRNSVAALVLGVDRENSHVCVLKGAGSNSVHLGVELDSNVRLAAVDGRIIENRHDLSVLYRDWRLLSADMSSKCILRYMDLEENFELDSIDREVNHKPTVITNVEDQRESYRLTSFIKSHGASVSQSFSSPYAAASGSTTLKVIKDHSPESSAIQNARKKRVQIDELISNCGPEDWGVLRLGVGEIISDKDLASLVKSAQRAISLAIEDYMKSDYPSSLRFAKKANAILTHVATEDKRLHADGQLPASSSKGEGEGEGESESESDTKRVRRTHADQEDAKYQRPVGSDFEVLLCGIERSEVHRIDDATPVADAPLQASTPGSTGRAMQGQVQGQGHGVRWYHPEMLAAMVLIANIEAHMGNASVSRHWDGETQALLQSMFTSWETYSTLGLTAGQMRQTHSIASPYGMDMGAVDASPIRLKAAAKSSDEVSPHRINDRTSAGAGAGAGYDVNSKPDSSGDREAVRGLSRSHEVCVNLNLKMHLPARASSYANANLTLWDTFFEACQSVSTTTASLCQTTEIVLEADYGDSQDIDLLTELIYQKSGRYSAYLFRFGANGDAASADKRGWMEVLSERIHILRSCATAHSQHAEVLAQRVKGSSSSSSSTTRTGERRGQDQDHATEKAILDYHLESLCIRILLVHCSRVLNRRGLSRRASNEANEAAAPPLSSLRILSLSTVFARAEHCEAILAVELAKAMKTVAKLLMHRNGAISEADRAFYRTVAQEMYRRALSLIMTSGVTRASTALTSDTNSLASSGSSAATSTTTATAAADGDGGRESTTMEKNKMISEAVRISAGIFRDLTHYYYELSPPDYAKAEAQKRAEISLLRQLAKFYSRRPAEGASADEKRHVVPATAAGVPGAGAGAGGETMEERDVNALRKSIEIAVGTSTSTTPRSVPEMNHIHEETPLMGESGTTINIHNNIAHSIWALSHIVRKQHQHRHEESRLIRLEAIGLLERLLDFQRRSAQAEAQAQAQKFAPSPPAADKNIDVNSRATVTPPSAPSSPSGGYISPGAALPKRVATVTPPSAPSKVRTPAVVLPDTTNSGGRRVRDREHLAMSKCLLKWKRNHSQLCDRDHLTT